MLGIGIVDEYHNMGFGKILLRLMSADVRQCGAERLSLGGLG